MWASASLNEMFPSVRSNLRQRKKNAALTCLSLSITNGRRIELVTLMPLMEVTSTPTHPTLSSCVLFLKAINRVLFLHACSLPFVLRQSQNLSSNGGLETWRQYAKQADEYERMKR